MKKLIDAIRALFVAPSVDKIVSEFDNLVDRLDDHANAKMDQHGYHTRRALEAKLEFTRALKIRDKIEALIGA